MPQKKEQLSIPILQAADPIIGSYLGMLADTRRRTKQALDGVTEQIAMWISPDRINISSVVYHLAAIEVSWLYTEVLAGQPWTSELEAMFVYPVRDDDEHLFLVEGESFASHAKRLDRMREILVKTYQDMSLEDFRRARQLPDYDVTPEWVLQHLMQHEAEHRTMINALRQEAEQAHK